jgi:hypothetical protein
LTTITPALCSGAWCCSLVLVTDETNTVIISYVGLQSIMNIQVQLAMLVVKGENY